MPVLLTQHQTSRLPDLSIEVKGKVTISEPPSAGFEQ
jgi:hypothetical protein